jgi:hypothetical protein
MTLRAISGHLQNECPLAKTICVICKVSLIRKDQQTHDCLKVILKRGSPVDVIKELISRNAELEEENINN